MQTLVSPSGFEESMGDEEVADNDAEAAVPRIPPDAEVLKVLMSDGGEGFTRALVAATGGTLNRVTVVGSFGEPVEAHFGLLGDETSKGARTAVLEMAAAQRLMPCGVSSRLGTTTYGVGKLIRAALDAGAERILVGGGDSGPIDGGAGMAQALGARLLDSSGGKLGWGGANLAGLDRLELDGLDPRIGQTRIDVACDPRDVLCGPEGVSHRLGLQEGASPELAEWLSLSLENYARVILRDLGIDVRRMPGGGASGGMGAGLHALLGANLLPRYGISHAISA